MNHHLLSATLEITVSIKSSNLPYYDLEVLKQLLTLEE